MSNPQVIVYKSYTITLSAKPMARGRFFGVAYIQNQIGDANEDFEKWLSSPRMFKSIDDAVNDILKRAKLFIDDGKINYYRDR